MVANVDVRVQCTSLLHMGTTLSSWTSSEKNGVRHIEVLPYLMNNECSSFITDELTKVGSDQRSSTIHYDSKSKYSRAYGFVFERH